MVTVDLAQVNVVRLNLELMGETILGEAEARRWLDGYLALLARDNVEYISVKIHSMCSQLNRVAFDHP
jgi:RHH-type proline utilization regulon transcriptional repressor/proline dehydrogenase/delta 1-pyrroline-5-carboxylate dehydrogenase